MSCRSSLSFIDASPVPPYAAKRDTAVDERPLAGLGARNDQPVDDVDGRVRGPHIAAGHRRVVDASAMVGRRQVELCPGYGREDVALAELSWRHPTSHQVELQDSDQVRPGRQQRMEITRAERGEGSVVRRE